MTLRAHRIRSLGLEFFAMGAVLAWLIGIAAMPAFESLNRPLVVLQVFIGSGVIRVVRKALHGPFLTSWGLRARWPVDFGEDGTFGLYLTGTRPIDSRAAASVARFTSLPEARVRAFIEGTPLPALLAVSMSQTSAESLSSELSGVDTSANVSGDESLSFPKRVRAVIIEGVILALGGALLIALALPLYGSLWWLWAVLVVGGSWVVTSIAYEVLWGEAGTRGEVAAE
ncbi:hypothetical protein [Demequina sp. NBRC 110054]|uniref:hypothetical protein n=1 Tax=Demequina sp. NBRC 110054 TaxID=1570343 RepID=UPI000A02383A|nr:hypothetical protein [Demequina sp. NBRC 110054]